MSKEVKWEACIAKSTLPKGFDHWCLKLDTWYPVKELEVYSEGTTYFWMKDEITLKTNTWNMYTTLKSSLHLEGGNFKLRKVKEVHNA